MIDNHGRLFGRINLVDATVAAFLILLVPLAYATYLLFRPSQPRIDSVTAAVITKEERRISAGARLVAKFKIRGTGLTPLLRARIDDTDALGFVFETPNSADVLVGTVPPGPHDLILLDGIQEVARARGVISVQPEDASFIRAVGWLTRLDDHLMKALPVGLAFPTPTPMFEILALGPPVPARSTIRLGPASTEIAVEKLFDRQAVMLLRCDPMTDENPCTMGDRFENTFGPVALTLNGPTRPFNFVPSELLPATEARPATIRVRLDPGAPASLIKAGDKDQFLDGRAAVVSQVDRQSGSAMVTLTLGVDAVREGWTYRRQRIRAGSPFTFHAADYEVRGVIESVELPR